MTELWIKQTVYKRLLIEDSELKDVKNILSQNTSEAFDFIVDAFDKNDSEEYDNNEVVLPFNYSTCVLANER